MVGSRSSSRQSGRLVVAARRRVDDVVGNPTSVGLQKSGGSTFVVPPPKKKRKFKELKALRLFRSTGDQKIMFHLDTSGKNPVRHTTSLLVTELGLLARTSIPLDARKHTSTSEAMHLDAKNKNIEHVMILFGDHLYRMNYMDFVEASVSKEKNLLVCCICHRYVGVCLKCSY